MNELDSLFNQIEWVVETNLDRDEALGGADGFLAWAAQLPTARAYGRTHEEARAAAAVVARRFLKDLLERDPEGARRLFALVQLNVRVPAHIRARIADISARTNRSMAHVVSDRFSESRDRAVVSPGERDELLHLLQKRLERLEAEVAAKREESASP